MRHDDALLRAVIDAPDDDAPRLVYADWCASRGDVARAEFVLGQCALAREERYAPRWRELRERTHALEREHGLAWTVPVRAAGAHQASHHRGFVEAVSLPASDFRDALARIDALAPVREVRFLRMRGAVDPVVLRAIGASARVARLRVVDARPVVDGPAALDDLLHARDALATVPGLLLPACRIGDAGARRLASHPFAALERLVLWFTGVGPAGVEALCEAPQLATLRALDLSRNPGTTAALRAVAASRRLAGLRDLRLGTPFGAPVADADDVAALARAPHLARLERLDLSGHDAGDEGLAAVASSPHMGSLRELALASRRGDDGAARVTDAGACALAASPAMRNLRALDLDHHAVGDGGAAAIAASPHLAGLGRLSLRGNPVSAAARAALRERFGPGVCAFGA